MAKNEKSDRRSQRTRQLLADALVELMFEKQYEFITVQEILDKANIGRSTFYAHFIDKEDLLMSTVTRMLHSLSHSARGDSAVLPSLELFRHVQEFQRLYKALTWGRGSDVLWNGFQTQLSKYVEQNLTRLVKDGEEPKVPLPVLADFVTGAFRSLLNWWLRSNTTYSPEQVDAMFKQLVYPGLRTALNQDVEF